MLTKKWRIIKSVRRLLFLNKLRVILTLAGIALGIACEMVTVALGQGARAALLSQIESMGSNLITVSAGTYKQAFGRKMQTSHVTTLKLRDANAIDEGCSFVKAFAPAQQQMVRAKYKETLTNTTLIGTTPSFLSIRDYEISKGRFFNIEENKLSMRAAVTGKKITRVLFGRVDPIGKIIMINDIPFQVIGTLKAKGVNYDGTNEDDFVFIPLNTALNRVFNINYLGYIYVQVSLKDKIDRVEKEIKNLLRERHRLNMSDKKDDFTIQNIYITLKTANETNTSLTNLITAIAATALIVGGIGILAVMLLSVKERTQEIGLRMAIGAMPGDVLFQFFFEAISLSTFGGILGIVLGLVTIYFLRFLLAINALVSFDSILISVSISVIIGILFGSLPARKASLVKPVLALRG